MLCFLFLFVAGGVLLVRFPRQVVDYCKSRSIRLYLFLWFDATPRQVRVAGVIYAVFGILLLSILVSQRIFGSS
jgi:hypothetical protein